MPNLTSDSDKSITNNNIKQNSRNLSNSRISELNPQDERQKVEKFVEVVNQLSKNQDSKSKNALDAYMGATSDFSYSSGVSIGTADQVAGVGATEQAANLGAELAEGFKGIGLGFFIVIDSKNAISTLKEKGTRKKLMKSLKYSLKIFTNPQKTLLKTKNKKNNIETTNYKDLVDELINSKDLKPAEIRKKLDLAVSLKEHQNNEVFKDIGLEYGFVTLSKSKSKGNMEYYAIDSEKIPDSIIQMRKDIEQIQIGEHRLGHGLGHRIKKLENTIKKLQTIQVYDSIKTINECKNKGDSANAILHSIKAASSAIGFAGIIGMLAAPPTLPITGSIFVAGVAVRSTSTLALFIKDKFHEKSVRKTLKEANENDLELVSTAKQIIGAFSEPIAAERFPATTKLFMESLNSFGKQYNFTDSEQEKILKLFEDKVLEKLDTNPILRREWDVVKDFWEIDKQNSEVLSAGSTLRTLCTKPIEAISEFIMKDIKDLKEVETAKTVDEAIDNIIDTKIHMALLSLAGIQKQGVSPADFIRQTILAHNESTFERDNIANETIKNINMPNLVSFTLERMPELLASGKSDTQAKSIIAHEIEQIMHKEIIAATEKTEKLADTQKLALLSNQLRTSIIRMV